MSEILKTNAGVTNFDRLKDVEFAGNQLPVDIYINEANRNLMAMSRTAQGVVDTSASKEKAQSMTGVSGEDAANLAKNNFDKAIRKAYENRDCTFNSPSEVRAFVESLAATVNDGIVKEGSLIRTSDSEKYPYARINNLENYMESFYKGLFDRITKPNYDPVETAAFAEFGIDFGGHFFADGCGKTAKVVSSFLLMRGNHHLPEYKGGRSVYYSHQLQKIAGEDAAADEAGYQKFLEYYKGLF